MAYGAILGQMPQIDGIPAVIETYPIATGNTITAGDVVDVVDGKVVGGKKPASAFAVGDIVRINENGSPVNYIIVNQGKPSGIYDDSCDGTWLLRQDLIEERVWDSLNANKLENSTIQSWLNNDMLKKYDSNIQNAIKQAKIPYRKYGGSGGSDQTGANGLSCKVFMPSGYEVGWTTGSNSFFPVDGAKLSYFESGTGSSANNKRIAKLNSSANHWYTRSPTTASASDVWRVGASGAYGTVNANSSSGIRPAFILNGSAKLNDDSVIGQAIALQDGSSGQSIEIIYSGTVAADWVTEGQTITSAGVYGVGVLDKVLQVWSKDRPGVKIETGNYAGTGTYGSSNPNSITFSFEPKFLILYSVTRTGIPTYSQYLNPYIVCFDNYPADFTQYYGLYDFANTSGNDSYGYFSDNTFAWYNQTSSSKQLNEKAQTYYYYAIG